MVRTNFLLSTLLLFSLIALVGCNAKITDQSSLYSYMNEKKNAIKVEKKSGDFIIMTTYIPQVLLNPSNLQTDKKNQKFLFFRLSFQCKGKDLLLSMDQSQYALFLNKISFKLGNYLNIVVDGKEEEIDDFQFTPMFGTTQSTDILFAIDIRKLNNNHDFKLKLEDIGIGVPTFYFPFNIDDIEKLEELTKNLQIPNS
ncbi:hypothetical protein [Sphingobacterium faecium]